VLANHIIVMIATNSFSGDVISLVAIAGARP
jgi:hypothetical protein